MSKRKGMPIAEKRNRLLSMYHKSKNVYSLNEVEKEAASSTGIVRSAILDVNQQLVDDGLVETDKIGSTGYYWSFPSKHIQNVTSQVQELTGTIEAEKLALETTKHKLEAAQTKRPQSEARSKQIALMQSLRIEITELEKKLEGLKENDPVEIAKQDAVTEMCRLSANRWADNTNEVKSWLIKKKGMSSKEAKDTLKQMGIASEPEYFN
jgi:hypothetical protein